MMGGNRGPEGSVPGRPFAKGADPRRHMSGVPERSGRKSKAYKEALRHILEDRRAVAAIKAVLTDPEHKHFGGLWAKVAAHVYGAPKQTLEVEGEVPVLRVVKRSDLAVDEGDAGET